MRPAGRSRREFPATSPIPPFRPPPWIKRRLANGLKVWLAEDPTVPLVNLKRVARAGARYDPPGLEGLAALVIPLLREGTVRRTGDCIEEETEALGADLLTGVDWDSGFIGIELLRGDVDYGIDLLADLSVEPVFPKPAMERLRSKARTELEYRTRQPEALADDGLARVLYQGSPYGRPLQGSLEGLDRLTRSALFDFHHRHFGLAEGFVICTGDFATETVARQLELRFPSASGREPLPPAPMEPPPAPAARVHLIDFPGSRQVRIRVGVAGGEPTEREITRLELLSLILGGGFGSRLNLSLRERRGYTYHVRSRWVARGGSSPLEISVTVDSENAGEAVREVLREIQRLRSEPLSADELENARNQFAGSFLRRFQSIHDLSQQLKYLAVFDLPEDFFMKSFEDLLILDSGSLCELAWRHLDLDRMAIVAVGPASDLRHQLSAFGELVQISPDGLLGHG